LDGISRFLGKLVPIDESMEWLSDHDAVNIADEKSDFPAAVWEPSQSDILLSETYLHATEQPAYDADVSASDIHETVMSTVVSRRSMSIELENVIEKMQLIKLTASNENSTLSDDGNTPVTSELMDIIEADTKVSWPPELIEWNALKGKNDEPALCSLPDSTGSIVLPIDVNVINTIESVSELVMKDAGQRRFDSTYVKESHEIDIVKLKGVNDYCFMNASEIPLTSVTSVSAQPSRIDTSELLAAALNQELVMTAMSAQFVSRENILSEKTLSESTVIVDSDWQSYGRHETVESVELSGETESSVITDSEELVVDEFCARWGSPKYVESDTGLVDSADEQSTSVSSGLACNLFSREESAFLSQDAILLGQDIEVTNSSRVVEELTELRVDYKFLVASHSVDDYKSKVSNAYSLGEFESAEQNNLLLDSRPWTEMIPTKKEVGAEMDEHAGKLIEMSESYEMSEAEAGEVREYDVLFTRCPASNEQCIINESACLSDSDIAVKMFERHFIVHTKTNQDVVPDAIDADQLTTVDTVDISESVDDGSSECCQSDVPTPRLVIAETEPAQLETANNLYSLSEPDTLNRTELLPFVANEINDYPMDVVSQDTVAEFASNSTHEDRQHDMSADEIVNQAELLPSSSQRALDSERGYSTENSLILFRVATESSDSPLKSMTNPCSDNLFKVTDSSPGLITEEMQLLEDLEAVNESDITLKLETQYQCIYEHLHVSNSRRLFTIPEIEAEVSDEGDEPIKMSSQGDSPDVELPRQAFQPGKLLAVSYDPSDTEIDERFSMNQLDRGQDADIKYMHSSSMNQDAREDCEHFSSIVSRQLNKQHSLDLDNSHSLVYHLHGKIHDTGVPKSPLAEKFTGTVEHLALPLMQQADELVEQAEVTEFFDAIDSDEEGVPNTSQVQSAVSLHRRIGLASEEHFADRRLWTVSRDEVDPINNEVSSRLDVSDVLLGVSKGRIPDVIDKRFWIPPSEVSKMVLGVNSVLPYIHVVENLDEVESREEPLVENDQKETEINHELHSFEERRHGNEGISASWSVGVARDVPAEATPTDLQCNLEKIHTITNDDESDTEDNDELNEHTKLTWNILRQRRDAVQNEKITSSSQTGVDVLSRLDNVTVISR